VLRNKWVTFALKLAVSAALIWFLARTIDIPAAADRVAGLSVSALVLALALFITLLVNNTVRWRLVMNAIGAPLAYAETFRILYVGMFFNQTLPSSVGGDAVRIYLVHRAGKTLETAVNGILLERVVTLIGLIALVVATQPILLARIGDNPAKYAFPALAGTAVLGVIVLALLDRVPSRYRRWRVVRALAQLAADTRSLFLHPGYALSGIVLGATGFAIVSAIAFVLGRALGIAVTLADCMVLVPPVMLLTTLPISMAGWGVREGAMVAAFGFIGIAAEDALVWSVLLGVLLIVVSLPGGLIWLAGGHRRADVQRGTETP
jgi:hypothetical protein